MITWTAVETDYEFFDINTKKQRFITLPSSPANKSINIETEFGQGLFDILIYTKTGTALNYNRNRVCSVPPTSKPELSYNNNNNILTLTSNSYLFKFDNSVKSFYKSFMDGETKDINILTEFGNGIYPINVNAVMGNLISPTGYAVAAPIVSYNPETRILSWTSSSSSFKVSYSDGTNEKTINSKSINLLDNFPEGTRSYIVKAIDGTLLSEPATTESITLIAPNIPISNICFVKGTPVLTDQGIIEIQDITNENTINNIRVKYITQTTTNDNFLVCIEKDAICENIPSQKTILSENHKLLYNGQMVKAENVTTSRIPYNGEILYNVLLEENGVMLVNNLVCETLDINNVVALLYKHPNKNGIINTLNGIKDNDVYKKTAIELLC
jgi:hypothetical protein